MPCYHPLRAFDAGKKENGKRDLVWDSRGSKGIEVFLPCGQCIGCRLERSRQWAVRCMHEADLRTANCFITLTYDEAHLPKDGGLVLSDFQKFMKRLRKRVGEVRFFHCGEYGDRTGRPHYHALLFGYDFPDKVLLREEAGVKYFGSALLADLWGKGICVVGALTFESAAYVARYVLKKVTGDRAEAWYQGRRPEYVTMSRDPGIGSEWFRQYSGDVFPSDEVIVRGKSCKPPRYYEKLLDEMCPEMLKAVKGRRDFEAVKGEYVSLRDGRKVLERATDSARLVRAENIKRASIRSLSREVE